MKSKMFLTVLLLMASTVSYAELSITNKWRIEQAVNECKESNNSLQYPEYWQDSVTEENKETLCMAEQFVSLVLMDGDEWLEKESGSLIQQCKEQSKKDDQVYFFCLQKNLEQVTRILSSPCRELGAAGLWDEKMCRQLTSYVFTKKFGKILEARTPIIKRVLSRIDEFKNITLVRTLFHPFTSILVLFLYVFDLVFLVELGNWMRVSKMSFIMGVAILGIYFTQGGMRHLTSGIVILILVIAMIWNHMHPKQPLPKKKKRR